jgi:16S rRNA processing protein RimM
MGEPIVVGRIGRAHGIRGDVTVDVRTDMPERRFAPGSTLSCDRDGAGPLTVAAARWHSGRLLVTFDGVGDRTAAEGLRGVFLTIDASELGPVTADDDDNPDDLWWDRDLIGLSAFTRDGTLLGTVADVVHAPGGDLLVVARPEEGEHLVPFVRQIVPVVEPANGRLVVDPPPGLLDLE